MSEAPAELWSRAGRLPTRRDSLGVRPARSARLFLRRDRNRAAMRILDGAIGLLGAAGPRINNARPKTAGAVINNGASLYYVPADANAADPRPDGEVRSDWVPTGDDQGGRSRHDYWLLYSYWRGRNGSGKN